MFKFEMKKTKKLYFEAEFEFSQMKMKNADSIEEYKRIYEWEVESFKNTPMFIYITLIISIITVSLNYLSMFLKTPVSSNEIANVIAYSIMISASLAMLALFVVILIYLGIHLKRSRDAEKAYYILKMIEEYENQEKRKKKKGKKIK